MRPTTTKAKVAYAAVVVVAVVLFGVEQFGGRASRLASVVASSQIHLIGMPAKDVNRGAQNFHFSPSPKFSEAARLLADRMNGGDKVAAIELSRGLIRCQYLRQLEASAKTLAEQDSNKFDATQVKQHDEFLAAASLQVQKYGKACDVFGDMDVRALGKSIEDGLLTAAQLGDESAAACFATGAYFFSPDQQQQSLLPGFRAHPNPERLRERRLAHGRINGNRRPRPGSLQWTYDDIDATRFSGAVRLRFSGRVGIAKGRQADAGSSRCNATEAESRADCGCGAMGKGRVCAVVCKCKKAG